MIKIKFKTKTQLKEIYKSTYQYKETATGLASDKTGLEDLFQGKKRLVKEVSIIAPSLMESLAQSSEVSDHIVENAFESIDYYTKINTPINNEAEMKRRERLRKEPYAQFLSSVLLNASKGVSGQTVRESKIAAVSEMLDKTFQQYIREGLKIDLNRKIISGTNMIPNPKNPTGFSPPKKYDLTKFLNLHLEAAKEFEEIASKLSGMPGYGFIDYLIRNKKI
jgi:hypothetical protein